MSFNSISDHLSIDLHRVLVPIVQHLSSQPDVFGVVYRRPGIEDYTLSDMFYIPEQANWSLDNLPDILYVIRPPEEYRSKAKRPVQKSSYRIFGKHVNDFETILPRQISSNAEGWRLEAWMRYDPRITAEDIIDRVHPFYRKYISSVQIHNRRKEFREHCNITCWEAGPDDNENVKITNLLEECGYEAWSTNSTRGLSPGLINPTVGEAGGRIALQEVLVRRFDAPDSIAYWVYEAFPWDSVSFWFSAGPVRFIIDVHGNILSSHTSYESVISRELYDGIISSFQVAHPIDAQQAKPNHLPGNLPEAQPHEMEFLSSQIALPPAQSVVHFAPDVVELQPRAIAIPHPKKRAPSDATASAARRINITDIIDPSGLPTPVGTVERVHYDGQVDISPSDTTFENMVLESGVLSPSSLPPAKHSGEQVWQLPTRLENPTCTMDDPFWVPGNA
ncbi:predicted protein [Aspergillus nidulans FGSC A4]|uniref:Uncharacterized protein n=1 Tax=Emericella nidulans (strain FGSC A4 / ATCC 38163 / CBS 112.46 / NRRL 194 / M139) TaxID=227321 RepID=Q5BB26_EMENI|nr:hypothetical protein [Aspergillus nidulans FGSC A4]EAA63939.1 predicted protein [Aspergillus nidulans FGSC A4]CBF86472.1 TPA: conserved hypothetical protein [Aspergillus nidulans FGSC A4]|eukprot:XP_659858.1 predicted protein [Aspergillus nidulans FGSC A4]